MSHIEFEQKRQAHTDKTRESGYTGSKPNGPVRKNTISSEVAAPTVKRGFVMSKIFGSAQVCAVASWLRGMVGAIRKAVRTTELVFLTTMLHQMRLRTQTVIPQSRSGAKTMTVITKASRSAAITPTKGNSPFQLHADARNALSTAVFYLTQPQANVAGARRKAIQALAALRSLDLSTEG